MNELLASVGPLASAVSGALVSAIWQGALLAGLVWAALRMVPKLSAAARSVVWLSVFALLIGLHFTPLADESAVHLPVVYPRAVHLDPRWSLVVAGLWVAASLMRAVQLVHGVLYLRRLARGSVGVHVDAALDAVLAEAAAGRGVRLCASDEIARPSVIGFFRPQIVIPAKLLADLAPEELRQVLIHEAEHLRRADDWTNLLQKLALVVFPLNPALAWVERRLCAERELACDDRVLAAGSGRKAYALCLAHLAEFALTARGFSLVLGAWERRPELARRVHRILRAPMASLTRRAAMGVTGGLLAAAVVGALALSRSPQLVSFAPAPGMNASALNFAQPDLQEMGRELGGRPQLVRATMPVAASVPVVEHRATVKSTARTHERRTLKPMLNAEVKLADLEAPPLPNNGKLLMMTEWNDLGDEQQMILADLRQRLGQRPGRMKAAPVTAVQAIYIVATPNGWLIVQI
jgi:hypothetical protein